MESVQLIFLPGPGMGHLVPAVEMGKLLIGQDEQLSITLLVIELPFNTDVESYTKSLIGDATSRIKFIKLPQAQSRSPDPGLNSKSHDVVAFELIDSHKPHVRDTILNITMSQSTRIGCVVLDMFCVSMVDVINELGLPSYIFFPSNAGFLGLLMHVLDLKDNHNQDITDYKDPDSELSVPSFMNPVPAKVLPSTMLDKNGGSNIVLFTAQKILEAKGIMINTFLEVEPYAIKSLSNSKIPPIYPVGPIINLKHKSDNGIMSWLDKQPTSSVVFLCFGSFGSFDEDQVKEIAHGLESSGCRFLWSLRRPPPINSVDSPGEYVNPGEALPEGFLDRTSGIGKVIGWAPQVAVLSHPAVGGFISHCGWNSILESLWFGVPIAAWPLYAEQQINAFEMIEELELAVNLKMDYRHKVDMKDQVIVTAGKIEIVVRHLMMDNDDMNTRRKKVKDMKDKSRRALIKGGSSYKFLGCLVNDILQCSRNINR